MLNYLHISKKMRTFAPAKCALGAPMGANGVHPVGRAEAMVALTI